MVSVIDKKEAIQKLVPFLDEMVIDGLVAMSHIQVMRFSKSPSESTKIDR